MTLLHAYSQTVADGTATSVVRPSDWNSGHNQFVTIAGNTAGQSTISGTNIVYQGGNNVTLSAVTAAGAATIIFSGQNTVAQTVQTQASGAIGGTGFTSTTTAGTAVTAALGTNGLSMAVPAFITTYANDLTSGRAGTGFTSTSTAGVAITAALGTNGLSMAVPNYITTYVNDLTSGRAGTGFTSTTTAGTAITAALGTNGLSMAVPNYLTTYAAQTTQTQAAGSIAGIGYTSTTQAGSTVGLTQSTNGLSVAWPAFLTTAAGGGGGYTVGFSASGGSSSFSTLTFSNQANDVTFINSGGQVALSHSLQPLSNTTQFAGTGTTLALTNLLGTIAQGSNGIGLSINNVDANYVAWELEGANTAGTTGTTLTTTGAFYLSGGNNITLSGNSNTIVIQGAAAGGGTTLSAWANNLYQFNSTIVVPRQSTSYVFPAIIADALSFDHMRFPMTVAQGTTTVATTINTTFSLGASYTINAAFYTTSGTNATSLGSVLTTSGGISHRISIAANSTGSQYSVSHFYTFPFNTAGSTSTISTSYASSQTNISLSSVTQMTGMKHFELAMNGSLPPNMYWMMIGVSSNTATAGVAGLSAALINQSHWGMSQPNNTWGFFGQANNASVQAITGVGSFTTAGGGTVAGFGFSNISSQSSHPVPYIYMEYDG